MKSGRWIWAWQQKPTLPSAFSILFQDNEQAVYAVVPHPTGLRIYSPAVVCHDGAMKTLKPSSNLTVQAPALRHSKPIPYAPDPEEVPGHHANAQIEPPPPAIRRTLKAKLNRRGPSQPVLISDPWE